MSIAPVRKMWCAVIPLLLLSVWSGSPVQASGVVSTPTEAALDAALRGGGTVTFACDGVIPISMTKGISADTVIDASGHKITFDGRETSRIFYVWERVHFTLNQVTLVGGLAREYLLLTAAGGAINSNGGFVTINQCSFTGNRAVGGTFYDYFEGDGYPGGEAYGGAIAVFGGQLIVRDSTFDHNQAIGGQGSAGVSGLDGSFYGYASSADGGGGLNGAPGA